MKGLKKIVAVMVLMVVLSGCSVDGSSKTVSNFNLKENCAKYASIAKLRSQKFNNECHSCVSQEYHYGTYYSQKNNTCLSLMYRSSNFGNKYSYVAFAYDELSGSEIEQQDIQVPDKQNMESFGNKFDLIK